MAFPWHFHGIFHITRHFHGISMAFPMAFPMASQGPEHGLRAQHPRRVASGLLRVASRVGRLRLTANPAAVDREKIGWMRIVDL